MQNSGAMQCEGLTEKVLETGLAVRIRSRGSSMYPTLSAGDRVIVSKVGPVRRGDIIVFRMDGLLVCHRLVRILAAGQGPRYQTRGDASPLPDDPILPEGVVGRVVRIERQRVSPVRRIFLLLYPFLSVLRLNAAAVRFAAAVRGLFRRG